MRRVLFMVMVVFFASLAGGGCAVTKHPLVEALSPNNIVQTITGSTSVEANVNARAKVPLLPPGSIDVTSNGRVTVITVRPPYDPERLAQLVRDEKAQGHTVKVVKQKGGDR